MQPELLAACSAQNNKAMSASTHGNEKLHGDSFVHRVSLLGRQIPIWKAGAACGSRLRQAVRAAGVVCRRAARAVGGGEAFALPGDDAAARAETRDRACGVRATSG